MEIIAHRGASGNAPENTMSAFQLAWQSGADGIELDLHMSRDGRLMVHHDADTNRCSDKALIIAKTDASELRQIDVGAWKDEQFRGESMSYLEEVLDAAPNNSRVLVEVKCGPECVPALQAAIEGSAKRLRVVVISFNTGVLQSFHELKTGVPVFHVFDCIEDGVLDHDHLRGAKDKGWAGVDPDWRGINEEFAQATRGAGLQLYCWTVNTEKAAIKMHELGVDGITTNYPKEMREAILDSPPPNEMSN